MTAPMTCSPLVQSGCNLPAIRHHHPLESGDRRATCGPSVHALVVGTTRRESIRESPLVCLPRDRSYK